MQTARAQTINATSQTATFYVDDLLIGIPIDRVQEINRHMEITHVPHAPDAVRGVINLRGEVVTVLDLRTALGIPECEVTRSTRNVIVQSGDQAVGLQVDRVSDIVSIPLHEIEPPPANLNGVDGRFFRGVYPTPQGIIVLLDVDEALADS